MVAQLEDLAQKAGLLNSQLRGLVRNQLEGVGSGSESVLASALEAKDMLDSCLSQYEHPSGGGRDHGGRGGLRGAAVDDLHRKRLRLVCPFLLFQQRSLPVNKAGCDLPR